MSHLFPATAVFREGGLMTVGGVPVAALAAEFGTPLYVLDRDDLVGRMRAYRRAFGPQVTVAYAAKALCVVGVLQLAAAEGLSVDVASLGELATAERAGVPPARVVFHGNNKGPDELQRAADLDVGRVVVDSLTELQRLDVLGRARGRPLPVLLRITPGVAAQTHAFVATGSDEVKFGFAMSTGIAHEAVERALAYPGVDLRGLHCHIGSQITAHGGFAAAADAVAALAADARDTFSATLPEWNLGGGLGIAYRRGQPTLALDEYAGEVRRAVADQCRRRSLAEPRLTVEPGRWIVGPAGMTLYRVGTLKDVPGVRTWASVDGGMSDNLRPALYGARYTLALAGRPAGGERRYWVAGKHCETGDVVAGDVPLPGDLREGDLLAVAATGAYGYAMASNYNRLPRPAMVLVAGGDANLLVRRETVDDVLSHDVPLPSP